MAGKGGIIQWAYFKFDRVFQHPRINLIHSFSCTALGPSISVFTGSYLVLNESGNTNLMFEDHLMLYGPTYPALSPLAVPTDS